MNGLSPRQRQVLELAARGVKQTEIARKLGIYRGVAGFHARAAREKLAARSTTQAVIIATVRGLIDPPCPCGCNRRGDPLAPEERHEQQAA